MNPSPNLGAQKQFNQKFEDFSSSSEDDLEYYGDSLFQLIRLILMNLKGWTMIWSLVLA